jgi:argininosuccinate lyase
VQEDKEHLFDTADTLGLCLAAAAGMVAGARFRRDRMASAASDELIAATDLADLLVKRGTPFREAHGVVAGLVREAVDSGRALADVRGPRAGRRGGKRYSRSRRGWSPRSARAARRLPRVREQLERARELL